MNSRHVQEEQIGVVRRFNRFMTKQMGVLHEGILKSPYSLTEARVLFELAQQEDWTAADLSRELGLDAGYMSRILNRLEQQGLIDKVRSEADGRQRLLRLTDKGKNVFSQLDKSSHDEVEAMLQSLSAEEERRLVEAMQTIESILGNGSSPAEPVILRQHEPGDLGWVVYRHGVLYAREYGWDEGFEALVAQIAADFINHYNPQKERFWIAEKAGERIGSVCVVQENDEVARLRLLLVEPKARGLGVGKKLVEECIRFARRCGYKKMVLMTNSLLHAARRIYEKCGFRLAETEKNHRYGHDMVWETWEMDL